jgi:hypothetical protein
MKKTNALLNELDKHYPNPYPRMTFKDMMFDFPPPPPPPKGKGRNKKGKKHWERGR